MQEHYRNASVIHKKVILATVIVTLLVGLVLINFMGPEKKVQTDIAHLYPVDDPQFLRSMGLLMGPSILDGNKVAELINGDAIFRAMLEAIRGAKKTILFETFIYWSGDIGNEMADALAERARAGLKVHVLLDWVGSAKVDDAIVDKMKAAGVEVEKFHPLRWYTLDRMNNRTHRKLLIVDGAVGFTGGVGIAPQWTGNAQDPDHWCDSYFRV
jgi:cardiolipin synthase A/B